MTCCACLLSCHKGVAALERSAADGKPMESSSLTEAGWRRNLAGSGSTEERQVSETKKIMCTVGSVVRKQQTILFVRQTYGSLKNRWTLPWGHVEGQTEGSAEVDTPNLAAIRETLEEGGIEATVRSLIAVQNFVSKSGVYMIMFVFLCDHQGGNPTPDMVETSESVFMNQSRLQSVEAECDRYCFWIANKVFADDYHELSLSTDTPYGENVGFC